MSRMDDHGTTSRNRPISGKWRLCAAILLCLAWGLAGGAPAALAATDCADETATGIPRAECEALMALYQRADGAGWTQNAGWNTDAAANEWHGVTVEEGRVTELLLYANQLSGPVPPELGNLPNLRSLGLDGNELTGPIPPELGNLANLRFLWLDANRLEGPVPPALGNLGNLESLYLEGNRLSGEIPVEFTGLTNLIEGVIGFNMLTASAPDLVAFLDRKFILWSRTQTVPPTDLAVGTISETAVRLVWEPIPFTAHGGHYRILSATDPGGPYALAGTTTDKSASEYTVAGLTLGTTYHFVVETFTPAHAANPNDLVSAPSAEISATPSDVRRIPGDANADDRVDLADAILILRILAGIDAGDAIDAAADVSGDARLGLEDLIYILRVVSREG